MKYHQLDPNTFRKTEYYLSMPAAQRMDFDILSKVFHFKVNNYVLEQLVDWGAVPNDPIYQLLFPRKEMLSENDYLSILELSQEGLDGHGVQEAAAQLRQKMKPLVQTHSTSFPQLDGIPVKGAYRSFENQLTLVARPMASTCHAYCSYCYRWISFADIEVQADGYTDPNGPIPYLRMHPEIDEVLFTGADALIAKSTILRKFLEPILEIETINVINISSKSLAWWPYRFTTDVDAKGLLALFKEITSSGKQLNFIAHFTHDRELDPVEVRMAAEQILQTGATIKTQGPIVKDINDSADVWASMWTKQAAMGMVPTYMFIEADHSPQSCFRIPLAAALRIHQEGQNQCVGLAKSALRPLFMNDVYRVLLDGTTEIAGEKYFVLKGLQGPPGVKIENEVRYIPYDEHSTSTCNLKELFDRPDMMSLIADLF